MIELINLDGWMDTAKALVNKLQADNQAKAQAVPGSADFQKLQADITRVLAAIQTHSNNGLRMIDESVAKSKLAKDLAAAAADAEKETNKLKAATATLAQLADWTNKLTQLVTGFGSLLHL